MHSSTDFKFSSFSVEDILSKQSRPKRKFPLSDDGSDILEDKEPFCHEVRHSATQCKQIFASVSNGVGEINDARFGKVRVILENKMLWNMFREVGTEMVITKSGRRMFPALRFSVIGLNPKKDYSMAIEIVSADNFRYKYHDSEWCIAGKAYPDTSRHQRMCVHPDSPSNGSKWTSTIVSFHKLKVTNNSNGSRKHVILNSLQNYQPRLHIIESNTTEEVDIDTQPTMTFVFNETIFMAVTAYQSEQMTQLKIDNNPFAKGFRVPSPSELERTRLLNSSLFGILMANGVIPSQSMPSCFSPCKSSTLTSNQPFYSPVQSSTSIVPYAKTGRYLAQEEHCEYCCKSMIQNTHGGETSRSCTNSGMHR